MEVFDPIKTLDSRLKSQPEYGFAYKLDQPTQYGMDASFGDTLDIDESTMSIVIPFADGNRRDGVGDLLEVTGIKTERHRLNPTVLFDHGKEVKMPVAKAEDPDTKAYTVSIDAVNKVAKVKAFFYGSKSEQQSFESLSSYAEQGDRFKHAVFCEQLFDLMAKGFIRGGSIGYQVLQATQLPVDHNKGVPQGLHLLSVLMLEASAVVMPANMDTVRKALEFKSLCGHPMSEVLVKSLTCHCGPKPVMLGYEGKKSHNIRVKISDLVLDEQNLREARENIARGQYSQTVGPVRVYRREGSTKYELGNGYHRIVEAMDRGEIEVDAVVAPEILSQRKSIEVSIPHGNLSKTNVPPAEWRPGVGAIKSLRGKYKAARSAKINRDDVRSYAQHGQLHAPSTQRRSATIHRDDVQHYHATGASESIPYAQEVKQPKSNNHHAAMALGGAALAAGAGYGAYRAGKWAVNKIRGKKAFSYPIVKGDKVELAGPIASGPHYEGQRLLYNQGETGSVLYNVGPDGVVWVKMPDGGIIQIDANAVRTVNPTKSLRMKYKDMNPKSRMEMERQNADKLERWLRERDQRRLGGSSNLPPIPPEEGGGRDDGNDEDPYRAIKAALVFAGLLGAVVVTKVGTRWLVRKLKPVASSAYETFKDQLQRRFGKVRDTGEAVEIEVKSLGQKAYLDENAFRELSREFLFKLREDLQDIGVEGVTYGSDVTHYMSRDPIEYFYVSIKLPDRDSKSTGRLGDIINHLKSRGYTLNNDVSGYQNKRAVLMLVGGVSAYGQHGSPYQKALDPSLVDDLASRGNWSELQEYIEEQLQNDGVSYGQSRFQANKIVQEEQQRRAASTQREPRTPDFQRVTPETNTPQQPVQVGEVVHRNEVTPQEIQLAIINAIPFVAVGGTLTVAMLTPLVSRVIDWLTGKGKKVTPKTKQVIEQEVVKEVKKRSKKSLTGQKSFDVELALSMAREGADYALTDYLKEELQTTDFTIQALVPYVMAAMRAGREDSARSELVWIANTYGTKSLDLRSKYRPVKGYVRRLRKSKPGSSVLYVHEKDLQRVRREAESRGVQYKYGGNRDGYERVVLNGDDSLIDDIARKYARPVAAGNYQTKSKRKK